MVLSPRPTDHRTGDPEARLLKVSSIGAWPAISCTSRSTATRRLGESVFEAALGPDSGPRSALAGATRRCRERACSGDLGQHLIDQALVFRLARPDRWDLAQPRTRLWSMIRRTHACTTARCAAFFRRDTDRTARARFRRRHGRTAAVAHRVGVDPLGKMPCEVAGRIAETALRRPASRGMRGVRVDAAGGRREERGNRGRRWGAGAMAGPGAEGGP